MNAISVSASTEFTIHYGEIKTKPRSSMTKMSPSFTIHYGEIKTNK